MKKIILLFLFVFLVILVIDVNADWLEDGSCQVNTNCVISKQLVNDTSGEPISFANCTIDIYSPINTSLILINDGQMSNSSGDGFYTYVINFAITGKYPSSMFCVITNSTGVLGGEGASSDIADTTFIISSGNVYYLYLALLIGSIVLFIIGYNYSFGAFIIFSGILLVVLAINIYRVGVPAFDNVFMQFIIAAFFAGLGLFGMIYGGNYYLKEL